MTKQEVVEIIANQYSEMSDDTGISGVFLVTITKEGRALFAHGEIDLYELSKALNDFHEQTEDTNG